MAANALVCWTVDPQRWLLEETMIGRFNLPLNLDQNIGNAFHAQLSTARRAAKQRAEALPVLPR
jgi:hypothetical protein